jgi:(acyl-carrier-protein) S-malonyltransferase
MKDAQNSLNKNIQNTKFTNSSISIISNFSGKLANNVDEIINNLSNQMSNRVRWVESIQNLEKINENKVIEIGPGKVLTGLIKRISNNFDISNIEYVTDIEKIKNEI